MICCLWIICLRLFSPALLFIGIPVIIKIVIFRKIFIKILVLIASFLCPQDRFESPGQFEEEQLYGGYPEEDHFIEPPENHRKNKIPRI